MIDLLSTAPTDCERRIPANCAHSSVKHPTQVPEITPASPRPYNLLNSGTVVLNPSAELDAQIGEFMHTSPLLSTWTFPDQDLLSAFFNGQWRPLAWFYNALITLSHVHKPLWADDEVRCLHYIGLKKPWAGRQATDAHFQHYVDWWWATFDRLEQDLKERDPETWELIARNTSL
jgi:lipopolysaccharide biosynthesis glycosyltransferase